MLGLETPSTARLKESLADVDPRVAQYLTEVVFRQSVGWQVHDKAACNILRVAAATLRRAKRILASLPGIRRVIFACHRGEYEGLLYGDYVEGEGYPVVKWIDENGVIHDGPPPAETVPLDPTSSVSPAPCGSAAPRPRREAKGWRKYRELAQDVVDATPARSVRGVAMIIRWAVEDEGREPADVVSRLIRLGDGVGVTKAALANDYAPVATDSQEAAETPAGPHLARSCQVSVALRPLLDSRPDLAPGVAILEALAQYRPVVATPLQADRWQQEVRGFVGDFTPAEAFAAVDRVHGAGRPLTAEWVARGIRGGR